MKKIIALLLSLMLLFALCACGAEKEPVNTKTDSSTAGGDTTVQKADTMPTVLNTLEYTLYTNIFFNNQGSDYENTTVIKEGTFTTLIDKFNGKTRYYVWGYNDQTKCCDWQWEFVPQNTDNLPADGSLIVVTGTFAKDEEALDGYWIIDPEIVVKEAYEGYDCDVDMTTMSATLERVQLINMQNYKEDFEGQSVYMYGRVLSGASLQHPYYDSTWSQDFITDGEVPAIGKVVIVSGTYESGVVQNAEVEITGVY